MKTNHTNGPWAGNVKGEIFSPDGEIVAQVYDNPDTGMESVGREPSAYNTALIGAAPELLDALRIAEEALQWYDNGENKAVAQGALKEIHAAIAKATQPIN